MIMVEYVEKRRHGSRFARFLLVLAILICVGILFKLTVWDGLKKKAVRYAAGEAVERIISSSGASISREEIEEKIDSMDQEDQDRLESIIENHIDAGTVRDVTGFVTSGDIEGAQKYVEQKLTKEDIEELEDLYNKYLSGTYGELPEH
jgi:hypothetical protein